MNVQPTRRLYLEDGHLLTADATVIAVQPGAFACDQSPFYPGGGGQPPDAGAATAARGDRYAITSMTADEGGVLWHHHVREAAFAPGQAVRLEVDRERRLALTRYHTVLHILNTIALRDHDAWITGVQIGTDGSRIDFNFPSLSASLCAELEATVNRVIKDQHILHATFISEAEFSERPELLRTLTVSPPVIDGRVRVVAINGFDAQACGGTHVAHTGELGRFTIRRTENKGRQNKRLYVHLAPPAS